jgi:hypothetical protein
MKHANLAERCSFSNPKRLGNSCQFGDFWNFARLGDLNSSESPRAGFIDRGIEGKKTKQIELLTGPQSPSVADEIISIGRRLLKASGERGRILGTVDSRIADLLAALQ